MKRTHCASLAWIGLMVLATAVSCVHAATNLAVVARPSTSYVSGDCSVGALNDGSQHRNSRDRRAGSYGNWNRTGTQWVQYDWTQPISTDKVDVYWWDDQQGVRLPSAARLLYWDGSAFVPVKTEATLAVTGDQTNSLSFEEVTTSRLKLEIDSDDTYSTGILEWRVYDSGKSPAFPPEVQAGEDRTVVLGGKTYLSGKIKTLDARVLSPRQSSGKRPPGQAG